MTPLEQTSAAFLFALGIASLKAAVLLTVALATMLVLRRRSAALKHLIWTIGLGATVAVAVLPVALPAWRVVPLHTVAFAGVTRSAISISAGPSATPALIDQDSGRSASISRTPRTSAVVSPPDTLRSTTSSLATDHWPSIALATWLIGAIVVLARCAVSIEALRRITRRASVQAPDLKVRPTYDGISRSVRILTSDEVEMPLTWGTLHPCVLLPADASEWSASRLSYVLQHELAHVARFDALTQFVAHAACAIFWFHPLVWIASRRMRHERERACDDRVLAQGAAASDYAGDLLRLVRTYGHMGSHGTALAMARRSQFEGRLLALLDPTVARASVSTRQAVIAVGVALLTVVPAAAMRSKETPAPLADAHAATGPAAGVMSRSVVPVGHMSSVVSAAPPEPTRAAIPAPVATRRTSPQADAAGDLFDGCGTRGSTHEHRSPVNGQLLWTAGANDGDCSYELTAHGDIAFNDDVTGIAGIASDGDVSITTNVRGTVTHLLARGSATGDVTYEFTRGGASAPFDAPARAWLAAFLTTFDRHTAFAIDQRLPHLLRNGGVPAALDEITRIHADHARMLYLVALTSSATLDDEAVGRTLQATARMRSDHDKVEVLVALAKAQRLSAHCRGDYAAIASALDADHDRRRALAAISRF